MACRDCAEFEIWKGEGYCNYFRKNTEGSDTCSHDTSGGGGCYNTERLALARETYDQYLTPIAAMIDGRQEQQAVDRYRKMVGELSRRYGVSMAG